MPARSPAVSPLAADARATLVLGRLILPVYVPIICGGVGSGMLIPVLPLYLSENGLSLRTISVVLASAGTGASLGGLPAGSLLARVSERAVLIMALVAMAVSTALLGLTAVATALIAFRLAFGAANAGLRLSRQTYVTRHVAVHVRGRAMSLFGGSFRTAFLIGPALGGVLVDAYGFRTTFLVAAGLTASGLLPALFAYQEPSSIRAAGEGAPRAGLIRALRLHRKLLLVTGMVPILVMTARAGRFVVLPLIGDELGLSASQVGWLVTVGTAADLALFPVSGWLMDRFGRLFAMVPSFGLLAFGLVLLGIAETTIPVIVASVVIGVGNGIGAGTMLTLGSDRAPGDAPGPFLSGLSALQDLGGIAGPLVVGLVGAWLGLGAAAIALACILVAAIAWLIFVIGETGEPR